MSEVRSGQFGLPAQNSLAIARHLALINSQKSEREISMQHTIFKGEHKEAWDGFCYFPASALFGQQIFARQKSHFVLQCKTRRIALKGGRNG